MFIPVAGGVLTILALLYSVVHVVGVSVAAASQIELKVSDSEGSCEAMKNGGDVWHTGRAGTSPRPWKQLCDGNSFSRSCFWSCTKVVA